MESNTIQLFLVIGLTAVGLLIRPTIWWARSLPARRWRCRRTTRQVDAELRRQAGSREVW
jgi:hypothetical protein